MIILLHLEGTGAEPQFVPCSGEMDISWLKQTGQK